MGLRPRSGHSQPGGGRRIIDPKGENPVASGCGGKARTTHDQRRQCPMLVEGSLPQNSFFSAIPSFQPPIGAMDVRRRGKIHAGGRGTSAEGLLMNEKQMRSAGIDNRTTTSRLPKVPRGDPRKIQNAGVQKLLEWASSVAFSLPPKTRDESA